MKTYWKKSVGAGMLAAAPTYYQDVPQFHRNQRTARRIWRQKEGTL